MMRRNVIGATMVAMLLTTACATTNMDSAAMAGAIPPPEVAGIMMAANEGEVQQGQAAAPRASSTDVRAFAQMMVTDHTNAIAMARETLARNGVTPAENDVSRRLRETSQRTVTNLATYNGPALDRVYMQTQVDLHQWLLTSLDTALIPSSRGEMRTLLETQRASVAMHLERARQILGRL
jgi:putative membrane protein